MDRNLNSLFKHLFDKTREISGIGVWHVDLVNQTIYWDNNTRIIHEVDLSFVPNLETGLNFYKEGWSRNLITKLCDEIIKKGTAYDTELVLVTAKGNEIWVRAIGQPQYDDDKIIGFYGTFQSIQGEKDELEKVEFLKERSELAAAAGSVGVWDWDVPNNKLVWDDQMYVLYGIKADDFSGAYESWQDRLIPEDKEPGDIEINEALSGKKEFDTQFRVLWPNGEIRYIKAKAKVFRDYEGMPVRMLGTNWDVTDDRNQKNDLENKNKELTILSKKLKESNEQLEEFAYVASHDLKTPIRNMSFYATFLEDDHRESLDDDALNMLKGIKDQAKRMTELVDDLLIYSKVNKMSLSVMDAPITSLVREVIELLGLSQKHDVEIQLSNLGELNVDVIKIREVFNNLVTNALKYNKSYKKVVKIWREGNKIMVQDNGIGIDFEMKDKVFAFFKRLYNRSEFGGGSGAGMAIVKKVLDRHKVPIDFESEMGKGTTFIMDFGSCIV